MRSLGLTSRPCHCSLSYGWLLATSSRAELPHVMRWRGLAGRAGAMEESDVSRTIPPTEPLARASARSDNVALRVQGRFRDAARGAQSNAGTRSVQAGGARAEASLARVAAGGEGTLQPDRRRTAGEAPCPTPPRELMVPRFPAASAPLAASRRSCSRPESFAADTALARIRRRLLQWNGPTAGPGCA